MGTLPAGLVAGNHYSTYEAFYQEVDPNNQGIVGALESAKFLKTSGLSDVVLSKIWDLADSNGKGYLTKSGFFVALKLVALVQVGKEPIAANLSLDVAPPKMGNHDRFNKPPAVTAPATSDWEMKSSEKFKYDELFDSLNPSNGFIPGNKVKGLLMDSKLPVATLGKIWDLADMDKDGALDRHEFSVAMHLVYKALEKYTIPACLPPELLSPNKRKDSLAAVGAVQVLPAIPNGVRSETPVMQSAFSAVPQGSTSPPLVQSPSPLTPLPSSISPVTSPPLIPSVSSPPLIHPIPLVHPLIPMNNSFTKPITPVPMTITPPQTNFPLDTFSPRMEECWVISNEEKLKYDALFEQADLDRDGYVSGHEIKDTFLKSGVAQPVLAHIWSLCDTAEQGKLNNEQFALALWLISRKLKGIDPPMKLSAEMVPPSCRKSGSAATNEPIVFSSSEVDRLTKEIDDLVKEKLSLETNISQREADIRIKAGEIKSLQRELDALVATLKQLENQKGEAVKRINDMKTQKDEVENKVTEVIIEVKKEQEEVNKLRHQAEEQERNLRTQEAELNEKKQELEGLKNEEASLKKERENLRKEIENITKQSIESAEIIEEIRTRLIELDDFQLQIKEAISHIDKVLESKSVTTLSEVFLNIEPKFQNESYTSLFNKILKVTNPITGNDPFADCKNNDIDFSKTDAFRNDPFESKDPFGSSGFATQKMVSGFTTDPFASFDSQNRKSDPFGDSSGTQTTVKKENDPFGCDPFAILHAPPRPGTVAISSPSIPRSESPSPALPPKKCKQPPPRPAPPRPAPPSLPSGFDADFADFSGFSHKMASGKSNSYSTVVKRESNTQRDPFRDYRYDDPFEIADDVDSCRGASAPPLTDVEDSAFDPFASSDPFTAVKATTNGLSKSKVSTNGTLPTEDQQLAWATAESVKSEKERRKRAEQEKADMKKALKLSKADTKKRSSRPRLF